jgi:hypothetical protein
MCESWRNGSGGIGRIRSILRTDGMKCLGCQENQAFRCSMDWEFEILFGRAQIQVFGSLESDLGLQRG